MSKKKTNKYKRIDIDDWTEEERTAYIEERYSKRDDNHILNSLGFYIGEDIVNRFLPTLSVDGNTRKIHQVTYGESVEYKRLNELWFKEYQEFKYGHREKDATKEWNDYLTYRYKLKVKYLPHVLKCHIGRLNFTEEELPHIKTGLIHSLWDSDICEYSLKEENVKIYDERYFTIIELKLGVDPPLTKEEEL